MSDFKRIDISLYQPVVCISHIRGNSPIAGSRPADSRGIPPDGGEASCFTISLIVRVPTSYELEMDGREHDRGSDGRIARFANALSDRTTGRERVKPSAEKQPPYSMTYYPCDRMHNLPRSLRAV